MNRRNIQVVLDISLSMKECAGMIYLFLCECLDRIWSFRDVRWSIQLTWFAGGSTGQVIFENEQTYTQDRMEFLRELRELRLKKGKMTEAEDVRNGCMSSMEKMYGENGEQILLLFTDYCDSREIFLTDGNGVNRVILFVPEEGWMKYRFRIVGKNGDFQTVMPIIYSPLEGLKKIWDEKQWECLLGYLKEGEEDD